MIQLYKNIKKLREERGMSQDALAKLTGYNDRSSITKIEKGQVDLQQSKIELFAKALGTSARELVGWDEFYPPTDKIMEYYNQLNDFGKHEATKRVEELTYIQRYTSAHSEHLLPNAAHIDETIATPTSEAIQEEENIMDSDNF